MFELDGTQHSFESVVRAWCKKELAPAVPALESGQALPYDLLRTLGRHLGVSEAHLPPGKRHLADLRGEAAEARTDQRQAAGAAAAREAHT